MSKLALANRVPREYDAATFQDIVRLLEQQANKLAEGSIAARHAAMTAAPTLGTWVKGDTVDNSAPGLVTVSGGNYVLMGWICTTSGLPGTWKERRVSTGTPGIGTVQVFTSGSGTYTTPVNCSWIEVEGWGGGASAAAGNTTTSTRGSGGGAGGYFRKVIANPAATYSYGVGAGGAGVTAGAGGADGNNGGNTTFSTLTANGGAKGLLGAAAGGQGGTASGGDQNITGQAGQVGQNGGTTTAVASGGSSPRGGVGGQSNVGEAGTQPGGGGSCGNHTGGAVSGAGAAGMIVVTEHYN